MKCGDYSTYAHATVCAIDETYFRTTVGRIVVCEHALRNKLIDLGQTLYHEMLHILYSGLQDGHFLNNLGSERLEPVKTVQRTWLSRTGSFYRDARLLTTPTVRLAVRRHFGCSSIEGLELQNETKMLETCSFFFS